MGCVPRGASDPRPGGCRRSRHGLCVRRSARVWSAQAPGGAGSRPVLPGRPPSSSLPSRPVCCGGGSCLRARRSCQASTTPYPRKPDAAIAATTTAQKARKAAKRSVWVRATTPTMANAASTHTPDLRAAFAKVRAGVLGGPAAVGPAAARQAWRSRVTAARSAWVRDASAWPTRASSSSLVSRSSTNAVLSTSIACSRSARDARNCPQPAVRAAISSPGTSITASPHQRDAGKHNAVTLC
jgi:hypothetical protein